MTPASSIAGVVLAGGASSRFGRDKAAEVWRGHTLLDWSVATLEPLCDIVYVAGGNRAGPNGIADYPHPGLGPLGGLAGALTAARDAGYDHLLSLPCDTPRVPKDLLARLAASRSAAFVAGCPVIGLWPTGDAGRLAAWLGEDNPRSMRAWAEAIGAQAIETDPIVNINRVEDIDGLGDSER